MPGVLAHRWSFDDDTLADSVGGSTATLYGDATVSSGGATITGDGTSHVNYISLGTNILPTTNSPVTIELWVTENQIQSWSRIVDFGSTAGGPSNLLWSFTQGGSNPSVVSPDGQNQNASTFNLGEEYHIALVLTPDGGSESTVTWYQMDLNGNLLNTGSVTLGWNVSELDQINMWLGRSEYGDQDADATYYEVRVWDSDLTEAQLVALDMAGPNSPSITAPNVLPVGTNLSIANGATLDLGGVNQEVASLTDPSGGGSVINSGSPAATLTVNLASGVTDTFSGSIGGGGGGPLGFDATGAGTFILAGDNTNNGGTTVSGGILQFGNVDSLSLNGPITAATGGILNLGGLTVTTDNAVIINGGVIQNGVFVDNGLGYFAESGTVTVPLEGSAGFTKTTNGTFSLSGTVAATYGGATTISSGSLNLTGPNELPTTTAVIFGNTAGAVLNLNGYTQTVASLSGGGNAGGNVNLGANGTLTINDSINTSYAGTITGSGSAAWSRRAARRRP